MGVIWQTLRGLAELRHLCLSLSRGYFMTPYGAENREQCKGFLPTESKGASAGGGATASFPVSVGQRSTSHASLCIPGAYKDVRAVDYPLNPILHLVDSLIN